MCSLVSFVALCIEVLVISCAVSGIVGDMSYQDHALDLARRAVADLATQYRATKLRSEANCLIYNQTTRTNSLKEGCSLFFVHIHKAGGSSVCETAVNNGYKVPPGEEENCNLPREASTNMNLTKYVEYIKENKLTFVAQENPPFRPHLPADNILYFLTIRNPLDRIISHLHHEVCENVYEKKPIRTAKNCTLDWSDMDVRQILTNKCLRKVGFFYMYNNFLMKYFSPCRGGCDSIDLAVAQSALEVFSAIVVVGEAEEVAW